MDKPSLYGKADFSQIALINNLHSVTLQDKAVVEGRDDNIHVFIDYGFYITRQTQTEVNKAKQKKTALP